MIRATSVRNEPQRMRIDKVAAFGLWLVVTIFSLARPALAHHSITAEFDPKKSITISGTLIRLEWVNPHTYFYLETTDASGKTVDWAFETGPPGFLRRSGVTKPMFAVGNKVTIDACAPKDKDSHIGLVKAVHFEDGHTIVFGAPGTVCSAATVGDPQ